MWLEPSELPEGCARARRHAWCRATASASLTSGSGCACCFEHGQITRREDARSATCRAARAPDERLLAEAARQPKRFFARLPKTLERRPAREVLVLAALRYARNDPQGDRRACCRARSARACRARTASTFGSRVAHEAAREHLPEALDWYARAGDAELDD